MTLRHILLAAPGVLLAGCTTQPYQPIGYSLPPPSYYGPRPSALFARPSPPPATASAPEPDYETPPVLLQPMDPSPGPGASNDMDAPAIEAAPPAIQPETFHPTAQPGGAVPLMGFRPMHGQTPTPASGAL